MPSTSGNDFIVRRAEISDLDSVKTLVDEYRQELGFVLRPALAEQINKGEMLVAVQRGHLLGFVDYHRRRDRQLTLYHIAVHPKSLRQGIGRALLDALVTTANKTDCEKIYLKCPTELSANEFYRLYGFRLDETLNGRKRPLNVWVLPLDSQKS